MGITVKPNGKYLARVRVGGGKRESKVFDSKGEALNWIESRKNGDTVIFDMSVDKWFNYWIENLMSDIRINTKLSYKSKYSTWIGPIIGRCNVRDIKPFHCMEVLNNMKVKDLKPGSIDQTRIVMHEMFSYAVENGLISTNIFLKLLQKVFHILLCIVSITFLVDVITFMKGITSSGLSSRKNYISYNRTE